MSNDLAFVRRCVKGDTPAWDEFINRYSRLIYSYIHSILRARGTDSRQKENISDIYQELFLFLTRNKFKKLKTYRAKNNCSLASWLKQVVVHFTLDYLRRERGSQAISFDAREEEGVSLQDILPDRGALPPEALEIREKKFHLKDCVARLDVEDKYFLELYLNQELDLQNISEALKISRPAADMRRQRIIRRLRACFKKKGFLR